MFILYRGRYRRKNDVGGHRFLDFGPIEFLVAVFYSVMVSQFTKQELYVDATLVSIALILFKVFLSTQTWVFKYLSDSFVLFYVILCKVLLPIIDEGIINRSHTHYTYAVIVVWTYVPFFTILKQFPKTFNMSELYVLLHLNSFVLVQYFEALNTSN
jgi:hypothetical protein